MASTTQPDDTYPSQRLTRVRLKNFFGIGPEGIDLPLGLRLTLMYGPNGVGKSTLQRVFDHLFGRGEEADVWRREWWRIPQIPDHMRHGNTSVECEIELEFQNDADIITCLTFTWPAVGLDGLTPLNACRVALGKGRSRRRWLVWETANSMADSFPHQPTILIAPTSAKEPWAFREEPELPDGVYLHTTGAVADLREALRFALLARFDVVRGGAGNAMRDLNDSLADGNISETVILLAACEAWSAILPASRVKMRLFGADDESRVGFGIGDVAIDVERLSTGERVVADVIATYVEQLNERSQRQRLAHTAVSVMRGTPLGEASATPVSPRRRVLQRRRTGWDFIVLEEPEKHLHAATQDALIRWLFFDAGVVVLAHDMAQRERMRAVEGKAFAIEEELRRITWFPSLIIETHSTAILRTIQAMVESGKVSPKKISILVFSGTHDEPTAVDPMPMSEQGSLLRLWPGPKP